MPFAAGTKESFLGAFLENIIYGVYLSAFIECCTLFWRRRKPRNRKQFYLMFTAGLMFLLITIRCIIDTYRCVVTFNTVDADFGLPNTTLGLVTNACWFFLTPLADAFLIFRTFVVWNGSWPIIVLPVILCLANLGSSFWVTIALARLNTDGPEIWGNIVWKSLNTFLSLSLATNIICTALISFRILQIHRQLTVNGMTNVGSRFGIKLVSVIVESAAMYTLLLVGILISNSVDSFVNFVFFNCTPPTIGLVFSYIIIRVSRGTSYGDDTDVPSTMDFGRPTTASERFELGRSENIRSGSQGEVQVRLERDVHQHSEGVDGFDYNGKYSAKGAV
ncbi:hypothetical protein C8F04DRAFT_1139644 [Mycena alexandri]|uniref:Uncharacterized protein n=1 Tax=Mycena alexandri TaxID=1745969 RepID=A0AAD6S8R5_9AGAR|nr:hypothetical protein C8F04DRAFT_1139644 [Mycena alexandri]